jgi:hypothetical protein
VKAVIAEDEEQVDKLLNLADQVPGHPVGPVVADEPDDVAAVDAEIGQAEREGAGAGVVLASLGLYRDALEDEVQYLLAFAEVKAVIAEDEEQVDLAGHPVGPVVADEPDDVAAVDAEIGQAEREGARRPVARPLPRRARGRGPVSAGLRRGEGGDRRG